ncbi:transcription factor TFIIIB component B'' [Entomortierella parvispora]|uniref:Transcription factor TFIIIB component B n=1 Tax=Entomortierella parvispora TaxID=205924 RepID=A0A9P3HDF1_9FUNG|nr:transcription factor TFIIIB component B'' [Entomortierella parvispora]
MQLPIADPVRLPQEIADMIVPLLTRHDLTQVVRVSTSWLKYFSPYLWENVEIRDEKTMRRFTDSVKEGALIRNGHHIRTLDTAYYVTIEHIAKLGRTCTRLVELSVESNLSSSTFGVPRYFSTGDGLFGQDLAVTGAAPLFGPIPATRPVATGPSLFGATSASAPTPLLGTTPAAPALFSSFGSMPIASPTAGAPSSSNQNNIVDTTSSLVSTFENLELTSRTQPATQPVEQLGNQTEAFTASTASAVDPLSNFSAMTLADASPESPTQITASPGAGTSAASTVRFGEPAFSSITRVIPGANLLVQPQLSEPLATGSTTIPPAVSQSMTFTFGQAPPQPTFSSGSSHTIASRPSFTFGQVSGQPSVPSQSAASQPGPSTFGHSPEASIGLHPATPRPPSFTFGVSRTYAPTPVFGGAHSTVQEYVPPTKAAPAPSQDRSYLALVLQRNRKLRSLSIHGSLVSRVYARFPGSTEVCLNRIVESLPDTIETLVISRPSNPFRDPSADDGSCYDRSAIQPMSIRSLPHLRSLHVNSALSTGSLREILTQCGSLERFQIEAAMGYDVPLLAETLKRHCPRLCELNASGPCPTLEEKDWVELLKSSVGGWKTLSFDGIPFTPLILDTVLEYADTLENLLIDVLLSPSSKAIQRILCSTPRLKRLCLLPARYSHFSIPAFLEAQDMLRSEWACCDTLESLMLMIRGIPRPDLVTRTNGRPFTDAERAAHKRNFPTISERTVYNQLGKLTKLQELILGHEETVNVNNYEFYDAERIAEAEYYDRNHAQFRLQYDCLSMSLAAGLDQLKDLKEMRSAGMSGISTRIDKGQTRFAPKLKARPNRNKTTASEDSTPAPTPQIGSTTSEAGSFASLLLESETSSPILSPVSSYTTAIVAPPTPAATQPDRSTFISHIESIPGSSTLSTPSLTPSTSESHIQRPGQTNNNTSGLSEEAGTDEFTRRRSVISSPNSAKGGSIISVPSTRTHAEREDDIENGDAASSTSNRKRARGKAIGTARSRQQHIDENEIDEAEQEGEGEEEEGDPEFPDYSNTPMYEFVKDMGVGRRSAVFLERQKQIDEQRRIAKLEKREVSLRASQTPGPYAGEEVEDEGVHDDLPSRQGTPAMEEKKAKREQSIPAPATRTFAPQVRLVDGRIELDIDSLTVDHATVDAGDQGPMEYVEESSTTRFVNSASFSKGNKGEKWSDEDTELFYKALAQWGTDFGIIHKMFKNKSRINVRNKFKREDRLNHARVQHALNNRTPMDLEEYSALTAKDFPEIDDVEETIKKMHEEELEKRAEAALLEGGGEYGEYDEYQEEQDVAAEEEIVDDGGEEIVGEVGDIP